MCKVYVRGEKRSSGSINTKQWSQGTDTIDRGKKKGGNSQKQSYSLVKETYSFFYFDRYALRGDYYAYKYTILFIHIP